MAVDLLPLLGNIDKSPGAARAAMLAAEAYTARARGKWGNPDPMLDEEQAASDAGAIHIFNVGPWNDWARLGSWGDFFLPAKPDNDLVQPQNCGAESKRCVSCRRDLGEKHAANCIQARFVYCCTVPGIYLEHGLNGEGEVQSKHIKGLLVAQNVVGEGDMLRGHNDDNRAKNGVFIGSVRGPHGRIPTIEDIERAEARLLTRFHELVDEANDAKALGGPNAVLSINEKHHLAAKRINRMDLEWARDKNPAVSFRCPGCGDPLPETAVSCKCGRLIKPAEFWAEVQQGIRLYSGEIPEMYRLRAPQPAAAAPETPNPGGGATSPKKNAKDF